MNQMNRRELGLALVTFNVLGDLTPKCSGLSVDGAPKLPHSEILLYENFQ